MWWPSGSSTAWGDPCSTWYSENSGAWTPPYIATHTVATKAANAWGLYDMSGNAYEWAWDWYVYGYYSSSPSADPEGPSSSPDSDRVFRGGSWENSAIHSRVANRLYGDPDGRDYYLGFRLSRTIP